MVKKKTESSTEKNVEAPVVNDEEECQEECQEEVSKQEDNVPFDRVGNKDPDKAAPPGGNGEGLPPCEGPVAAAEAGSQSESSAQEVGESESADDQNDDDQGLQDDKLQGKERMDRGMTGSTQAGDKGLPLGKPESKDESEDS